MFFKLIVVLGTILNLNHACPSAKKANLRQEEINDYQRVLTEITGNDARKLAASVSPMNAPQCLKPGFVLANRKSGIAAAADIRFVYTGVRADFYKLIDSIINGKLTGAPAVVIGTDPAGLGAPGLAINGKLNIQQQAWRVANILGNAARLAFHDAGEVDITTADKFGSDGCLSDSGPNSGLKEVNTVAMTIIEPLWQKYCDKISRADFWVLFAKIALESGLPDVGRFDKFVAGLLPITAPKLGNAYLDIPFQYGRPDAVGNCDAGAHRLPEHQPGLGEFERVYVRNMGLTVRDGVILNGAHSVGHVHTQFSGFGFPDTLAQLEQASLTNAWDESPWIFDNLYFHSLAEELWLNNINSVSNNVIPNVGGTPNSLPPGSVPSNAGTNIWAVQIALGVQQPVPACSAVGQTVPGAPALGQPATCGVNDSEQVFCTYRGVTRTGPKPAADGKISAGTLSKDFGSKDPLNPCNCVDFFATPQNAAPANCAMAPHPKTIMLNSDMVQNFPISAQGGIDNVVDSPALDIGTGLLAELCFPFETNFGIATLPRPPRFNTNQAVDNTNLVFPKPVLVNGQVVKQGFGCVTNTLGHPPNFPSRRNRQTEHSSLLPKDPIVNGVSLWATVQSFLPSSLGGCLEGISTFNGLMNPYGGSIKNPLPTGSFIGNNAGKCTDATPADGAGRDNFYREFEIAFTKMTTVGFRYSRTFYPPTTTGGIAVFKNPLNGGQITNINVVASGNGKLGTLTDISLGSSTCTKAYPTPC